MAVKVGEIARFMEEWAPCGHAEEWDNVGLLVGSADYSVDKVLIALDAVNSVIDEAIEKSCEMIVTHHPLFRQTPKKINDSDNTAKKIIRLIENKIALYSAHTNLDKADGGVNDELCRSLGLDGFVTVKDENGDNSFMRTVSFEEPQTLESLARQFAGALKTPYIPVVGDLDKTITKAAIVSGSGMSMMKDAAAAGASLFISGDIRYHDANAALEYGMALLDLTHYASEALITGPIKRYLEKKRDENGLEFEALVSEIDAQPFRLVI